MVINFDIREHLAQLEHYSRFDQQGITTGFTHREWRDVLDGMARDTVKQLGGFDNGVALPNVIRMLHAHIYSHGYVSQPVYDANGDDLRIDPAEHIYSHVIDSLHIEFEAWATPYIKSGDIWNVEMHKGHLSLTYVGYAPSLRNAIKAAGGNYNQFLQQFF